MCHQSPQQIETLLQMDCDGKFRGEGESPQAPFRFFVPFQNMPSLPVARREDVLPDKHYRPQDDINALRSDLHHFVFIQATEERLRTIVHSDWNTRGRLHLYHYRDTNHREVVIPDAEMRLLIATIQDRHLQFYIDQPLDDFAAGDRVILKKAPWTGRHGIVRKVSVWHGQLCMTISLNILGRTKSINFTDVRVGDVLFEDAERGRLLSDNPINNYEEEILDLLSHRFGHRYTDEVADADRTRLKRLASYDHIYVDTTDERARFTALRLLCAYLLQNAKRRDYYLQQVMSLRPHPLPVIPQTSTEDYLMTALFITTRQAHWRTAVKEYRNTHPDCPPVFRRYYALIKDLKAKKLNRRMYDE